MNRCPVARSQQRGRGQQSQRSESHPKYIFHSPHPELPQRDNELCMGPGGGGEDKNGRGRLNQPFSTTRALFKRFYGNKNPDDDWPAFRETCDLA